MTNTPSERTPRENRRPSLTSYTVSSPRSKPNKMRMNNILQSPPERTPRKRGPQESREDYKIYYDNFWVERDIKKPPATSIATLDGRGIDVDEIGEYYYADNGEPVDRHIWGFVKHKWNSLDKWDKETFQFFGVVFWVVFWFFSALFVTEVSVVFMIPWVILSTIGAMIFISVVKHQTKRAWDKYFPEYQEFKQEYKSKHKTNGEQMLTFDELFEEEEETELNHTISRKTDWLCSKCGQVSNNSEPCYDCARKEWDANPVPPPPPAPSRPTRDSSRKSYPPPDNKK